MAKSCHIVSYHRQFLTINYLYGAPYGTLGRTLLDRTLVWKSCFVTTWQMKYTSLKIVLLGTNINENTCPRSRVNRLNDVTVSRIFVRPGWPRVVSNAADFPHDCFREEMSRHDSRDKNVTWWWSDTITSFWENHLIYIYIYIW